MLVRTVRSTTAMLFAGAVIVVSVIVTPACSGLPNAKSPQPGEVVKRRVEHAPAATAERLLAGRDVDGFERMLQGELTPVDEDRRVRGAVPVPVVTRDIALCAIATAPSQGYQQERPHRRSQGWIGYMHSRLR